MTSPRVLQGFDDTGSFNEDDVDADADVDAALEIKDMTRAASLHGRKKQTFFETFKKTLGSGDLAGFQMIWGVVSLSFVLLKVFGPSIDVSIFDNVAWWTIFVLPLLNTILTGIFDYLMGEYHNEHHIESLIQPRFAFLFVLKVGVALYVFGTWLFSDDKGFINRYQSEDSFAKDEAFCICQVWTIFIACSFSIITAELMITTNIINSESNLFSDTPTKIRVLLLLIRPFVWVYNRAMIMFLSFYVFYGTIYIIFTIGIVCDLQCSNDHCRNDLQIVGVQFLLIPFSRPDYLATMNEAWQPMADIEDKKLTAQITLTFLVTSFWVDVLNGIIQAMRRFVLSRYFPKHCSMPAPALRQATERSLNLQQTTHHSSLGALADEGSLRSNTGGGGGGGFGGGTQRGSSGTMILKSGSNVGSGDYSTAPEFGSFTSKVAKAKSKRMLSQNPLADVLTKHATLSRIVDDEEDNYTITPAMDDRGSTQRGLNNNSKDNNMIAANNNNLSRKNSSHNMLGTAFLYGPNASGGGSGQFLNQKQHSLSDRGGSRNSQISHTSGASGGSINNDNNGNNNNNNGTPISTGTEPMPNMNMSNNIANRNENNGPSPYDMYKKQRSKTGAPFDNKQQLKNRNGNREMNSNDNAVSTGNNNNNNNNKGKNSNGRRKSKKHDRRHVDHHGSPEDSIETSDDFHSPPPSGAAQLHEQQRHQSPPVYSTSVHAGHSHDHGPAEFTSVAHNIGYKANENHNNNNNNNNNRRAMNNDTPQSDGYGHGGDIGLIMLDGDMNLNEEMNNNNKNNKKNKNSNSKKKESENKKDKSSRRSSRRKQSGNGNNGNSGKGNNNSKKKGSVSGANRNGKATIGPSKIDMFDTIEDEMATEKMNKYEKYAHNRKHGKNESQGRWKE